jgi:hypothetical protein
MPGWEPCTVGTETWRCKTVGAYEAQYRVEQGRATVYRVLEVPTSTVLLTGTASGLTDGRLAQILDSVLAVVSARRTGEVRMVDS